MKIEDQTDEQLDLALKLGMLERYEREQINDELWRRARERQNSEQAKLKRAREAEQERAREAERREAEQRQERALAEARARIREATDAELIARHNEPADIVEQLLAREEIKRRAARKKEQAVRAALGGFAAMSHDELLKWSSSGDFAEDKAAAKELRVRIKALKAKLDEVVAGGLKPVERRARLRLVKP